METKWSLTHLYKTDEDWQIDYALLSSKIENLAKTITTCIESKANFQKYLEEKIEVDMLIEKVYCYPRRHLDLDSTLELYKSMFDKALNLYGKIVELNAQFENIVITNEDTVNDYLTSAELHKYYRYISLILRRKEHIVSDGAIQSAHDLQEKQLK